MTTTKARGLNLTKNGTWLKVLSVIMGLNLFVLGYIVTEVRETRQIAHQVDTRTALLEYQMKTMDGRVDMKEAFELFETLKKTNGR
jgi:hypothetical protein